jgi:hypothetical protein
LDAEPNGIRYKLDVLDARNTGMRELRSPRHARGSAARLRGGGAVMETVPLP